MYQHSTTVKIGKNTYELHYPTVGQQLEIENLKNVLTKGKYAELAPIGSKTSMQILDLVDAVSYFNVLSQEMKQAYKLTPDNFDSIDLQTQRTLSRAFIKFYNHFVLKVEEEINSILDLQESDIEDTLNEKSTTGAGL